MAKLGRPSAAQSIANAMALRETLQSQIVTRLAGCTGIRKVLVDMGKKVTLPELKYMAYAHILDVMNDDKVHPRDRLGYVRLVFELDGDIGTQRGEIKHKHMLEFSKDTLELLASRVKQLQEQDHKPGDVIDVVAEEQHYAALPEKAGDSGAPYSEANTAGYHIDPI